MDNLIITHGPALFNIVMLCGSLMIIRIMREEKEMERESIEAVNDTYRRALDE